MSEQRDHSAGPGDTVRCVVCGDEQRRAPGPPDIPHRGGWTCMRHRDQQARLDREAAATPREPQWAESPNAGFGRDGAGIPSLDVDAKGTSYRAATPRQEEVIRETLVKRGRLPAATPREPETPQTVSERWESFIRWEQQIAGERSGLTKDQLSGAAVFHGWLLGHREVAAAPGAALDVATMAQAIANVSDEDDFGYDDDHAARYLIAEYNRLVAALGATPDPLAGGEPG